MLNLEYAFKNFREKTKSAGLFYTEVTLWSRKEGYCSDRVIADNSYQPVTRVIDLNGNIIHSSSGIFPVWFRDSILIYENIDEDKMELVSFDVKTKREDTIYTDDDYWFNPSFLADGKTILFWKRGREKIYNSQVLIFDVESKEIDYLLDHAASSRSLEDNFGIGRLIEQRESAGPGIPFGLSFILDIETKEVFTLPEEIDLPIVLL